MAFVTKLTIGFLTFSNRKQRVVIGGEHSTWTQVISGVPQGTVLGPLLFLTYISDLPNNIHSSIRLFADDCVLYREIKNENDSQELQKDLNSLMKWEYDWQMHFNPRQYFVMRLTHARHLTRFNYILGDTSLQETGNHPYLGVHITKDLTWNKHIHQITATANRTLAFVRRNLYSCPQHIKKSTYTQLLFVHFLNIHHPYGTPIYQDTRKQNRNGPKTCSSLLSQ